MHASSEKSPEDYGGTYLRAARGEPGFGGLRGVRRPERRLPHWSSKLTVAEIEAATVQVREKWTD